MAYLILADDDLRLMEPVADYFRAEGHRVELVTEGPDVLRLVLEEPPDVLLIDTFLTSLDAFMVLQQLFDRYPESRVRTVVMSAIGADGEPIHDWSMPVDTYLLKPCRSWELILAVEQLLFRTVERTLPPYVDPSSLVVRTIRFPM